MKIKELIKELSKLDQEKEVYFKGGEYNGDYRKVYKVVEFQDWGTRGYTVV